ncbi:MAG: ribosome-binding factor A [Paludibacter sp.]|nr:ribosome-binding factor A [Paludibacter sp.]
METTRQLKIARLLQKELGEIFMLYAKKLGGVIISVTNVKISPDLSISHVSLSIFPGDRVTATLELVKQDTKQIRYDLGKRVKNQLRIIPELVFHLDDTLDYLENIDQLLKKDPPSPLSEDESNE